MVEIWSIINNILFLDIPIIISFKDIKYVPLYSLFIFSFFILLIVFIIQRLFETDGGN